MRERERGGDGMRVRKTWDEWEMGGEERGSELLKTN